MKYATDEDRDLQDAIDQWRTGSTEAFHDIESWRDDAEERDDHRGDPQRQWPEPPENLYGRTLYLIGQLTARYRHLDTGAIMATYEAVDAWHTDHRDTRLPNQVALEAILDRATMTLQAVETDICGRRVREEDDQPEEVPAAVEHPADGPAPGTTSDDYVGAKGLREGGARPV